MRYLLITYVRKADGKIDEQVTVATKVKTRDIQTCNIIIDYKDRVVTKCVVDGHALPSSFEKMDSYYRPLYPAIIERLELEAGGEVPPDETPE